MSTYSEVVRAWKTVYSNWRYTGGFICIVLGFYLINVVIQHQNYKALAGFYANNGFLPSVQFFGSLALGLHATMAASSFISLIMISVLIGFLFTLITYKANALKEHGSKSKKQGAIVTIGIFLGIAAPGCAVCGVGVLALLGIGGGVLGSLPLKGLEVSLAAIVILAVSVWFVSKGLLECKTCQVKLNQDALA